MKWIDRFLIWIAKSAIARENARALKRRVKVHCEFAGCGNEAVHHIRWGNRKTQDANACQHHMKETWEACQPQVAVGTCFWNQGLPVGR